MHAEPEPRRYHDLTFDADLMTAIRDDGGRLRFSRLERALLATLAARPGRLFSREQLLSAMRAEPEDVSDRNVDFLVNRLRRKLADPARAPRFIATQYGEGYVWIAPPVRGGRPEFLVIGPVRGAPRAPQQPLVEAALQQLRREMAERSAVGQEITLLPSWSREDGAPSPFRFSIGVDLMVRDDGLQAAFTLRDQSSGRNMGVVSCSLTQASLGERLGEVAEQLVGALWRDLALPPGHALDPAGPPLEIRMQDAAMVLSKAFDLGWGYIGERLTEARRLAPDEPVLAVMWATCLYARMLFGLGFEGDPEAYGRMEREIERLVLGALPDIRADPVLRLAAAKLLFIVDPAAHLPLVEALVDESLSASTAYAAALSQLGAIQAYRGELDAAATSFDQALAFCEPGAEFRMYLLVKQSAVRLAQDDWSGARANFRQIVAAKPAARPGLVLRYLPPHDGLDSRSQRALAHISETAARQLVTQQLFMFARYLRRPEHVRNFMAGMLHHLLRRFGPGILPPHVPGIPDELLSEWRAAPRG
ncbi:winged helix-turn-helix domain-containing protein [Phenylobacterium sp.]|uniref:winged helix-turn-helix domain-containing protein n=1 Tax=Phenylobacterium sp. TaxID=1871053 RepID=UPI0026153E7F|nr:winged helix-turn-helix domain-containing protein [Phenylobacterium sp.]